MHGGLVKVHELALLLSLSCTPATHWCEVVAECTDGREVEQCCTDDACALVFSSGRTIACEPMESLPYCLFDEAAYQKMVEVCYAVDTGGWE